MIVLSGLFSSWTLLSLSLVAVWARVVVVVVVVVVVMEETEEVEVPYRRCSNYIFILDLTHGFIGLGKDNYKTRRETFKFGDLVRFILEILR